MIIVTGGSSGIGKATVELLRERTSEQILAPSRLELNVAHEESWREYFNSRIFGETTLTGLVNCAGVSHSKHIDFITLAEYENVMDTNARSVLLGMQFALDRMNPGASIVNVSSIFATHGGAGRAIAYQASKAAVLALSRNVAIFYGPSGVRVNTVLPGFVKTPMTAGQGYEKYAETAPMGRMLEPKEVAEVIAFLLSPRSSGMTGAEVYVDGGWNAR